MKGMPGNMQGLLKQAQKMQKDLQSAQEESLSMKFESSAGGGAVKVVVNGQYQIESFAISQDLIATGDKEMIENSIVAAINQGMNGIKDKVNERMQKVTGGMSIPGLF